MCGTELAYGAGTGVVEPEGGVQTENQRCGTDPALRSVFAMRGTDIAYAAMSVRGAQYWPQLCCYA
eukprot:1028405-Rhodomonas_salina.1